VRARRKVVRIWHKPRAVEGRAWRLLRRHYLQRLRLTGDRTDMLVAAVLRRRGTAPTRGHDGLGPFRCAVAAMARELRGLQRSQP